MLFVAMSNISSRLRKSSMAMRKMAVSNGFSELYKVGLM